MFESPRESTFLGSVFTFFAVCVGAIVCAVIFVFCIFIPSLKFWCDVDLRKHFGVNNNVEDFDDTADCRGTSKTRDSCYTKTPSRICRSKIAFKKETPKVEKRDPFKLQDMTPSSRETARDYDEDRYPSLLPEASSQRLC